MAGNGNESRMLSGWKTFTFVVGVIGLVLAVFVFALGRSGAAIESVFGSLALMLLSAVLEWMGEVEHHLSLIAADAARSDDRVNGIIAKLDKTELARPMQTNERAAAAQAPAAEAAPQSGPKMYDAKAVADLYRRSQQ